MDPILSYLADVQKTVDQLDQQSVETVIRILHEARLNYQNVFILGNGGSAATASHFVCDLAKNTRTAGCQDFRVIGLADNMAILSAYANDEGYENVFAMQLKNLVRPEDVVIAISSSGNSPNVLKAVELANEIGAKTIGFTGRNGGRLGSIAQIEVRVPNQFADQIEDVHLILAHLISRRLRELAEPSVLMTQSDQMQLQGVDHPVVPIKSGQALDQPRNIPDTSIQQIMAQADISQCSLGDLLLLLSKHFRAISGSFLILNEAGEVIDSILAYTGNVCRADMERIAQFLNRGLAGWVVKHQVVTMVMNTSWDNRWLYADGETTSEPRSVLCAPVVKKNWTAGVITLARPESTPFSVEEMFALNTFSQDVQNSLEPCWGQRSSPD